MRKQQLLRIKVKKWECLGAYRVLSLSLFNRYFVDLGCAKTLFIFFNLGSAIKQLLRKKVKKGEVPICLLVRFPF
jgi:hypothetical protein